MISKPKHNVHLVGIAGSGMKPLAEIALYQGYQVTGSDRNPGEGLKMLGVQVSQGHESSHLPSNADLVVYSSAIPDSNPEILSAKNKGIPVIHRSEFLARLCQEHKLIAISGTHGKTTTTAMIAHILDKCGYEPTAFIGGEILGKGRSSYTGNGEYFVAEVDESDGSLLNYSPFVSVINNIDLDHLDFYDDLDHIKETFIKFCKNTDIEGCLIFGWDNPNSREVGLGFTEENRLGFGCRIGCDVRGLSFSVSDHGSQFQVMVERDRVEGSIPLFGRYNFQNLLCALAVARALEVDITQACQALQSFPGVLRRTNCIYQSRNVKIFDDYAHNPGKISAVIEAIKSSFDDHLVKVVFQPHRYSRMKTMYNEFAASFSSADEVFVTSIFSAGEEPDHSYEDEKFVQDLQISSSVKARYIGDHGILDRLSSSINRSHPTVLITVGAGDVNKYGYKLRDFLNEKKQE